MYEQFAFQSYALQTAPFSCYTFFEPKLYHALRYFEQHIPHAKPLLHKNNGNKFFILFFSKNILKTFCNNFLKDHEMISFMWMKHLRVVGIENYFKIKCNSKFVKAPWN